MRLARKLGGDRAELLAALFGALCPPLIIFGSRCTTENASAALVVIAALLLEVTPNRRRAALAGALIALAVLFRYQNGLIAVGFFLGLFLRGRWSQTLTYVLGALPVAAAGAEVDQLTWGAPFKPLMVYLKFNTTGGADRWGVSPFPFFAEHLSVTIGLTYGLLVFGFFVALRRAPTLVLVVLFFVLVHSQVPHKELRFITPILPLGVALSAVGLAQLMDGLRKGARPTRVLALVCGAQMAWQLQAPTLGDLGYGSDEQVVWHANEDYYEAELAAAAAPDLCGISLVDSAHAWTGGYTYLHRDVPVFFDTDPRNLAAANYLVGAHDEKIAVTWKRVAAFGSHTLYHRDGECGPVPRDWTLDQL
jgi:4-amino-4-deoxy-L-arabinose transferase-like glycosyltransferase